MWDNRERLMKVNLVTSDPLFPKSLVGHICMSVAVLEVQGKEVGQALV